MNKELLIDNLMRIIQLRAIIRTRGLDTDIANGYGDYFKGAKGEMVEFERHLNDIDFIIADIECGYKYLDKSELREFEYCKRFIKNKSCQQKQESK